MNAKNRRFPAGSGHERSQQFRLRSHNTNFVIRDLDALSESAQVIPPIAAPFEPHPIAGSTGECVEHIGRDRLIARAIERQLNALRIGGCLIPDGLQSCHALLQRRIIQIGQAGFDSVIEAIEPLIGFRDSPVEFSKLLAAPLCPILPAVEKAAEDSCKTLRLEEPFFQMAGDQVV